MILDEAMTALDSSTQKLVKGNMKKFLKNKTTIIVTHQIANIKEADIIMVMKDGKIIEQGKHESLIKSKGIYYELDRNSHSHTNKVLSTL